MFYIHLYILTPYSRVRERVPPKKNDIVFVWYRGNNMFVLYTEIYGIMLCQYVIPYIHAGTRIQIVLHFGIYKSRFALLCVEYVYITLSRRKGTMQVCFSEKYKCKALLSYRYKILYMLIALYGCVCFMQPRHIFPGKVWCTVFRYNTYTSISINALPLVGTGQAL
jgi:hypothetical protein